MRRQHRLYGVVAGVLVALLIAGTAALVAASQDSMLVGIKVKIALLEKLGVDALHVDVDDRDGRVTLSGTVKKRETAELAEGVAGGVGGVTAVQNDLKLAEYEKDPSKLDVAVKETGRELEDALLQSKVRLRLIEKMGTDGVRIGTEAAGATVTLELPRDLSHERREEAVSIARQVPGVQKVLKVDKQ